MHASADADADAGYRLTLMILFAWKSLETAAEPKPYKNLVRFCVGRRRDAARRGSRPTTRIVADEQNEVRLADL